MSLPRMISPSGPPRTIWPAVLLLLGLLIAAVVGLYFTEMPGEMSIVLALGLIPGLLVTIAVLRNPFLSLLLVFVFTYFRPQDNLGALKPLHLPLVTSAGAFALFMLSVIFDSKRRLHWSSGMSFLTGILVLMFISIFTSSNNYWAFQFFRGTLTTVMFSFLILNLIDSFDRMRYVIGIMVIAHCYLCFKGIRNFVTGGGTTGYVGSSFLGDENDFALALIVIFPFVFFSLQRTLSRKGKTLWGMAAALILTSIMLTMSRGGFVGIAATLGFMWLVSPNKMRNAAILVFMIIVVAVLAPAEYYEEIGSIKNTDQGTAHLRREYWKAGLRMYAEHPLIGVGPANCGFLLPIYMDVPNANQKWGRALHGTLPQLMAEMGTIGLFLYGGLFLVSMRAVRLMRRIKVPPEEREYVDYLSLALMASMIGYVVTSTFLSTLYYPHIYVIAALVAAAFKLTLQVRV
ncbi:MAG: hypothetical protein HKN20_03100, partial [Gemmatimonadetes bacterium]|nr:hypothetical protein [Gemmatimonadota bacterium]